MTKDELAERLADIALSQCAHDSDPNVDEHAAYDKRILIREFTKALDSYLKGKK